MYIVQKYKKNKYFNNQKYDDFLGYVFGRHIKRKFYDWLEIRFSVTGSNLGRNESRSNHILIRSLQVCNNLHFLNSSIFFYIVYAVCFI